MYLAYYEGRLLPVKDGEKSLCVFDETDSEIKIKSLLHNPYITEAGFDSTGNLLLGVIFKSTEKIIRTSDESKMNTRVLDNECSFIETTRLGNIDGGTKVQSVPAKRNVPCDHFYAQSSLKYCFFWFVLPFIRELRR